MFKIYVYVLDTLADWELGYVIAELNSGRFFKKDAPCVSVKTDSFSKEPVKTMGGLTIVPDCLIDDIAVSETSVLLLPGANTWNDPKHSAIIEKAGELLSVEATVCAICGATVADNNLITAGPTGALLWARQIIEHLGVFQSNTLESWYEYFRTGEPQHFFALMQTLSSDNEKTYG